MSLPLRILLLARSFLRSKAWTKEHFVQEIARQHIAFRDEGMTRKRVCDLVDNAGGKDNVDVILACGLQYTKNWKGMAEVDIPSACVVTDYFPRHYDYKDEFIRRHDFDIVFMSQRAFVDVARERQAVGRLPAHTRFVWLPFSVDWGMYGTSLSDYDKKDIDVTAIMSGHSFEYPNRPALFEALNKWAADNPQYNTCLKFVDNPNGLEYTGTGIYHEQYVDILKRSKIVIGSCDQHRSVNIRIFEAMAAEALYMTDGPPKDMGALGLFNSFDYEAYDDHDILMDKLSFCLKKSAYRHVKAMNGQTQVRRFHTNTIRVQQMTAHLSELITNEALHV
jgi:hypothetical protein